MRIVLPFMTYIEKGAKITRDCYMAFLIRLKERRDCRNIAQNKEDEMLYPMVSTAMLFAIVFCRSGPRRLLVVCKFQRMAPRYKFTKLKRILWVLAKFEIFV